MGLFSRREKKSDAEMQAEAEAKAVSDAELERNRLEDIRERAKDKAEQDRLDREAARTRRQEHDKTYRETRQSEAVSKAREKARSDAATVGMAPGTKAVMKVVSAVRRLSPSPTPATTTEEVRTTPTGTIKIVKHYPAGGGGGSRSIPAFQMPGAQRRASPPARRTRTILVNKGGGVYEERHVPVGPQPAAQPAKRAQAGFSIPAFSGAGGVSSPLLTGGGMGMGGGKGKRAKTGIPFLDQVA